MNRQPCNNCPFRSDVRLALRKERIEQIIDDLSHDKMFYCHKTISYTDDSGGTITDNSLPCVGSAKFLEAAAPGGMRANFMYRIALMSNDLTLNDGDNTPVYESVNDFLNSGF